MPQTGYWPFSLKTKTDVKLENTSVGESSVLVSVIIILKICRFFQSRPIKDWLYLRSKN